MDKKFRVNEIPTATAFRRGESSQSSQQQQPQMQSSSSSQYHQDLDLQNLESSFGRLSFTDPSVRQNQYTQMFNGGGNGGYLFPTNDSHHHRELELQRFNQRVLFQNDCVNGSYGNNGFFNGVSYPSRNLVSDQNPWDYRNGINGSWRGDEGFGYNQDPSSSSSMKNGRGSRLLMFAKDRVDSKSLENKIHNGSKEQIDIVFNNLIDHICDLMVDPFGTDVVKKLMVKCDSEQITKIVDVVTVNQFRFVNICFDSLGSDAIQMLLTQMKARFQDQIPRIVGAISMVAVQLTRSNHAKHVILKCFTEFNLSQYRNLLEVVARNCYQIAIDQHGCCMLQQCLTKGYEIRHPLFREIISHALKLCLNCYGNYVVQYVVELYELPVTEQLIMQLVGSYGYLARNKYGSHVVQKLLKKSGIDSRLIVHDLLQEIDSLLLDPFGNYVVQTAWFVSKDQERHMLRFHIERNIRLMRCNKFGNKILEKLNL